MEKSGSCIVSLNLKGKTAYVQGQMCVAGSRTFVHESVYDEYLERAKTRAEKRVVGDPFKSGVEHGPQVRVSNYKLSCVMKAVVSS